MLYNSQTLANCRIPNHAHCKKTMQDCKGRTVLGQIVHYINGARHIENFPNR